jgi:hypothetical protein
VCVYLIKKLRDQGLSLKQLNTVFDAIILSRITYAVSAWSGFLTSNLRGRIDAFLRRMYKNGFCSNLINFQEIVNSYDLSLYRTMINCDSCIYQLLPPKRHGTIALRPRGHNFVLPVCKSDWFKSSFVNWCLY